MNDRLFLRGGFLAAALFIFALGLRLVGIGWGLPNERHDWSYHPDEPIVWGAAQVGLTPGFYNYGTLYLVVVKVATDAVAAFGGGPDAREPHSTARFIGRSHLAGRVFNAVAGAATASVVLLMLLPLIGRLGGAAAGLFVAIAPAHVVHSRFQTVDVPATLFLALSAWFALRLLQSRDSAAKQAVLSGLFAGLSAGTKYTGILALLTLFACLWLARPEKPLRTATFGTVSAVLSFLLVTPGSWLDTERFVHDFLYEMRHTSSGHGLVFEDTPPGIVFHVANLFAGIGVLLALAAIAGLAVAAWKRRPWAIALLAFAVPYYLLIGGAEVKFLRYTFPLYIGLAAGFGWAVAGAHRRGGAWRLAVAGAILALGGESYLAGLRGAATYTTWMSVEDPRDEAASYLSQVGAGKTVGLFGDPWFYTPSLYADVGMPRPMFQQQGASAMAAAKDPAVVITSPGSTPDFVTVSTLEVGDLERLSRTSPNLPEVAKWIAFKAWLDSEYVVDRRFGGRAPSIHDLEYVRPQVTVWRRK